MSGAVTSLEALAYADNCLDPERRAALEAQLRVDPQLRAQVERWRGHNESIRAAFGAPERPRGPLSLGRPSNENKRLRSAGAPAAGRAASEGKLAVPPFGRADPARSPSPMRRLSVRRRLSALARSGLILALSAGLWIASAAGGPVDRRAAVLRDAGAAFRAFGQAGEPGLAPAQAGPAYLRERLAPVFAMDGWTPLGARILPGLQRPALLALFANARGERAALWVEATDAAPDAPARTGFVDGVEATAWLSGGLALATVGAASFGEAVRLVIDASR